MGNGETKSLQTINNKKKSFSFDTGDFSNFNIDKIKPINVPQNHNISSSLDITKHQNSQSSHHNMPSISLNRQSSSIIQTSLQKHNKLSIKQQNAKLQKLNKNNDQLRKQLIQINQKLAIQLQKKKVNKLPSKSSSLTKSTDNKTSSLLTKKSTDKKVIGVQKSQQKPQQQQKDKFKIIALKKQLQNAYSQVTNYKRQIQGLKKNQSSQSNIKLSQFEDKITIIDQQINTVQKSLTATRDIVEKQRIAIGQWESEMGGSQVEEIKKEIVGLKQRLKHIKENSRKKQKDQKLRHQLLIQMERKLREINGQYLPQFKNHWSIEQTPQKTKQSRIANTLTINPNNKSRIQTITKSKQQQQQAQLSIHHQQQSPPTKTQFQQLLQQHSISKKNHEQFNKKIYNEMKKKNELKQQRQKILERLIVIEKSLDSLSYKKDRYTQLIMGNIDVSGRDGSVNGMVMMMGNNELHQQYQQNDFNEQQQQLTITKGQDKQGQIVFGDKKLIKNYQKIKQNIKIVTVNIWLDKQSQNIIALQFFYTDEEEFFVGNKSSQINVVTQKRSLELQQGDYVHNVMGIFNVKTGYLEFIVFQSIKGKVLKVGKQSFKNNSFNLGLNITQRPVLITGACVYDNNSWRVNKLQFIIRRNINNTK